MGTRIINVGIKIRSSLWFVPTLMTASAIALAGLTLLFDHTFSLNHLYNDGAVLSFGHQGARVLLATVAGSVMSIAGVSFSITIVALTLAASHFGPRLLKNFMKDVGNQIVLGTFIATFIYCLFVLGSIRDNAAQHFVPQMSITVAMLLTLISVGVFIYFIHHVSVSIHAENVITSVGLDLEKSIHNLFPEKIGREETGRHPSSAPLIPPHVQDEAVPIRATSSGYLQALDQEGIMRIATEHELLIHLHHRPGEFIVAGEVVAAIWPPGKSDDTTEKTIWDAFLLGNQRTEEQDVEFAIHQLVEVALRALSPGINDPFTAIACIDRLGACLSLLAERKLPSTHRYDDRGTLRVIAHPITIDGIFDAAFHQIRQTGCACVAVGIRLLETLRVLATTTQNLSFHDAVRRHAALVHEDMLRQVKAPSDLKEVEKRYDDIRRLLGGQ